MTSTLRSLLLLSACAVTSACTDPQTESPKPKTPSAVLAPATPALLKTEPMLAATAPASPTSVIDKPAATQPATKIAEQAKPEELVPDTAKVALAHAPEPTDYARPLDPSEVKIDRFVLAHDVKAREPVDESERFDVDTKIFAFMQFANPDAAPFAFRVHWEPLDGLPSPYGVELKVETAPRYRTWSWTAIPREPGKYKAVLRTLDGETLAEKPFTVELGADRQD